MFSWRLFCPCYVLIIELCIKDWPELWSQLGVVLIHPCQVMLLTFQEQMRMNKIIRVWVFKGQYRLCPNTVEAAVHSVHVPGAVANAQTK